MIDLVEEFALATDGIGPLVVECFRQWGVPNKVIYSSYGTARYLADDDCRPNSEKANQ